MSDNEELEAVQTGVIQVETHSPVLDPYNHLAQYKQPESYGGLRL